MSYLYLGNNNKVRQFFADILTYWVLYSNLVPIRRVTPPPLYGATLTHSSLFVTVEIVKYSHAFLINSDLDIYYPDTDTPAVCRTSSLVEELGRSSTSFLTKPVPLLAI